MAPRLVAFGYPQSHYCVSVDRMLHFKRLSARWVRVPYHDKRALLEATGQDFVPALVSGSRIVPWQEIPAFLDRIAPSPPLLPPGHAGVATALEEWAHKVVEERVWRSVVTRVVSTFPGEVERWVFEEMQTRSRGPFRLLDAQRATFVTERDATLRLIDRMLEDRPWVLDEPSVADFAIYGSLSPMTLVGDPIPAGYRNLRRWAKAIERLGPTPRAWRRASESPRS